MSGSPQEEQEPLRFFSSANKDFVLNEGPREFDGNILLLRTTIGFEQPSKIQFTHAQFWAKAIDIPAIKQTSSFAKVLADNLGQFMSCDETNLFCVADNISSNPSSTTLWPVMFYPPANYIGKLKMSQTYNIMTSYEDPQSSQLEETRKLLNKKKSGSSLPTVMATPRAPQKETSI
ncbi:LOW QUALITY PROTEIN: hypothetical protein Cgig2_020029 [Carnegiea gigantea]|uniref:Uncharacterized protein n=1 Tax=Carnegiea gigantea TaxID=171969 RepID=A0A9Q1QB22_9CARY|nr:LOW QUALITY PROTEIN: hypothetical protein Cgig2_020029 [Carnegiea gigantea]